MTVVHNEHYFIHTACSQSVLRRAPPEVRAFLYDYEGYTNAIVFCVNNPKTIVEWKKRYKDV